MMDLIWLCHSQQSVQVVFLDCLNHDVTSRCDHFTNHNTSCLLHQLSPPSLFANRSLQVLELQHLNSSMVLARVVRLDTLHLLSLQIQVWFRSQYLVWVPTLFLLISIIFYHCQFFYKKLMMWIFLMMKMCK